MQHGEAVAGEVDPDRPLSGDGRRSVETVAAHAAVCGVRLDRIVHSPKLRAEQSAGLLARALGCTEVGATAGLAPRDSVEVAAATLIDPADAGALAIVGHLPFLDRLASLLVTGESDAHVIAFCNGGLVRLVPAPGRVQPADADSAAVDARRPRFAVAWILTPELAAAPRS